MRHWTTRLAILFFLGMLMSSADAQWKQDVEKGYINPGFPPLQTPPFKGERYSDNVPDTLDLAEMAELAHNGLTGPLDPDAGYELYFMVNFFRNPMVMYHDFGDGCVSKFLGPMTLMRIITGSDRHADIEQELFMSYLKATGPDGLYHHPIKGHPWLREGEWDEIKGKDTGGSLVKIVKDPASGSRVLHLRSNWDWKTSIQSVGTFPRGGNVHCTYKIWGDAKAGFPKAGGAIGPWWNQSIPSDGTWAMNTWQGTEAAITGAMDWTLEFTKAPGQFLAFAEAQGGNLPAKSPAGDSLLSPAFNEAFKAATTKATALTIRVTLGDTTGGKLEWSKDNGATWTVETSTIGGGSSSNNAQNRIGWLNVGAGCFIDDIIVSNDRGELLREDWEYGAIRPDRWNIHSTQREPPPYGGGGFNARVLEGWMIRYLREKNPMWKDLADKMATRVRGNVKEFVQNTNDWGVAPGTDESKLTKGFLACDAWTIQSLAQYLRLTGNEDVKKATRKLINQQKDHIDYFNPDGSYILTTPGVAPSHFHVHALCVMGFLEYALAAGDKELAEYARKSYEWARSKGSALTGFFPERIETDFPNSEGCPVADMVAYALMLSKGGVGDYWDDADRWIRNYFAELQLTPEKAKYLEKMERPQPPEALRYNETDDRVIERSVGAFAGWPGPNDWLYKIGIQHCCTGNGARAIYYAWENILNFKDGVLSINLLLNRASPWADVYSSIPYEGKVDLKIKKSCQSVRVRMPEWIQKGHDKVECRVNGKAREGQWEGRYVNLGPAGAGEKIVITFPITERTVKERMGGVDCTMVVKGNTVVSIDPPGKNCPLYMRAKYRQNQAPMKKVNRFVSSEFVEW